MHSLDPDEYEYKGRVVKDNSGYDGHLALEVNVLEVHRDDCYLEDGVHKDPEGYHEDKYW